MIITNYTGLFFFLFFCNILAFLLIFLAYLFAPKSSNIEKLSAYECGFEPFSDARLSFDIHFYIVGVLFILFDLEVSFLVPWALTISETGKNGFLSIFSFMVILGIGFIYEWKLKGLEWQSVQ